MFTIMVYNVKFTINADSEQLKPEGRDQEMRSVILLGSLKRDTIITAVTEVSSSRSIALM